MNKLMLSLAAMGVSVLTGCFKASVEVPDVPRWGEPPPTSNVRPADSNDKTDVIRENQELRARNAWLERQIEGRQRKHADLLHDQKKLQDDIARTQRERARFP